jgi:hypothetical protein
LDDLLTLALRAAKAGSVDGNEVGGSSWTIFMHGKDDWSLSRHVLGGVVAMMPMLAGFWLVGAF